MCHHTKLYLIILLLPTMNNKNITVYCSVNYLFMRQFLACSVKAEIIKETFFSKKKQRLGPSGFSSHKLNPEAVQVRVISG